MERQRAALVIGGTGGVGCSIAARLVADGIAVTVASRAATTRPRPDVRLAALDLDIRDADQRSRALAEMETRHGGVDILVDCSDLAFEGTTGAFSAMDAAAFAPAVHLWVTARLEMLHAAHPLLAARGGAVVLLISDAARYAAPRQSVIGATRAALAGFVRNYALEAAREGIRANCVSCSFIRGTPIFDALVAQGSERVASAVRRAGLGLPEPEDIASLVGFLCSPGARRVTGQVVSVNGGLSA